MKHRIGFTISIILLVFLFSNSSMSAQTFCYNLDFESLFDTEPHDGLKIDSQYFESHYISFALEDSRLATLAKVGAPIAGFNSEWGDDTAAPNQDIGKFFLTDDGKVEGLQSTALIMNFQFPARLVSGDIIDIDFDETFLIQARDINNNVIAEVEVSEDNSTTGSGLLTRWEIERADYEIHSIRIEGSRNTSGGFGFGFDNFSACILFDPFECNENEICSSGPIMTPTTNQSEICILGCTQSSTTGECNDNAVWYEILTDDEASILEIAINGATNFSPTISIFESNCSDQILDCTAISSNELFTYPIKKETSYFIEVSSSEESGVFNLCVATTSSFECNVYELCGSGPILEPRSGGPEECAEGCTYFSQEGTCYSSGVWFEILTDDVESFLDLSLSTPTDFEPVISIYEGDCSNPILNCYAFDENELLSIPVKTETSYFVEVASGNYRGVFNLYAATTSFECNFNEECGSGIPLAPITDSFEICTSGCTIKSTKGRCTDNGVWFKIETSEDATLLVIRLCPIQETFTPIISLYLENCENSIIACDYIGGNKIRYASVRENTTYYLEVASDGQKGLFDLCVSTRKGVTGSECTTSSLKSISRPEYPSNNDNGPFFPGETVNFCFEINQIVDSIGRGNNCQFLQGIIPVLGGGWDQDINPINETTEGPQNGWFWIDENQVQFSPWSSFSHPNYYLTTTYSGNIGLGSLSRLNQEDLMAGDFLPGGWWFASQAQGNNCTTDTLNPNTSWGMPSDCGSSYNVECCFDLTVKKAENLSSCINDDLTDLSISIFSFTDGMTGCWSNNSCNRDRPAIFDAYIDCSQLIIDNDGDGFDVTIDCDDNDPNNYPGNTEICDGLDNNCNNLFDEGFEFHTTPNINCLAETSSITLLINDTINYDLLIISIDGELFDTTSSNSMTIDNLDDNTVYEFVIEALFDNGCFPLSTQLTCETTRATSSKNVQDLNVRIYPNPSSNIINIHVAQNLEFDLNIYNLNGQLIEFRDSPASINMESYTSGFYIIELIDRQSEKRFYERILKQ